MTPYQVYVRRYGTHGDWMLWATFAIKDDCLHFVKWLKKTSPSWVTTTTYEIHPDGGTSK